MFINFLRRSQTRPSCFSESCLSLWHCDSCLRWFIIFSCPLLVAGVYESIPKAWTKKVKTTSPYTSCWYPPTNLKLEPNLSSLFSIPREKRPKLWVSACYHIITLYFLVRFTVSRYNFICVYTYISVTCFWFVLSSAGAKVLFFCLYSITNYFTHIAPLCLFLQQWSVIHEIHALHCSNMYISWWCIPCLISCTPRHNVLPHSPVIIPASLSAQNHKGPIDLFRARTGDSRNLSEEISY